MTNKQSFLAMMALPVNWVWPRCFVGLWHRWAKKFCLLNKVGPARNDEATWCLVGLRIPRYALFLSNISNIQCFTIFFYEKISPLKPYPSSLSLILASGERVEHIGCCWMLIPGEFVGKLIPVVLVLPGRYYHLLGTPHWEYQGDFTGHYDWKPVLIVQPLL